MFFKNIARFKIIIFMTILFSVFSEVTSCAKAEEVSDDYSEIEDINSDYDYSELDKYLDEKTGGELSFTEYVESVLRGNSDLSSGGIFKSIFTSAINAIEEEMSLFSAMFLLMAMTAIFSPFTGVGEKGQTSELGFYIMYMLVISVLVSMYAGVTVMTEEILARLVEFMKILTPAYMMGVAFCNGMTSASALYGISMFVIGLCEGIILKVLFPAIDIYLCIVIANRSSKNAMFTKMSELIFSFVVWANKLLVGITMLICSVQSLTGPGIDRLKRSTIGNLAGSIPVIGNSISSAAETVLGAGVVLKNIIGVGGVIAITILCIVPLSKIFATKVVIKFSTAITEPLADRRLTEVMNDTSKAVGLLLKTSETAVFMFIILIVIVAIGTGL